LEALQPGARSFANPAICSADIAGPAFVVQSSLARAEAVLAIGADLHLIRGWHCHCRRRITPTLRYDAAVAYSGIGYDGTAGTAQGDFSGQRWLVSTGLSGICEKARVPFN
jgi:hypothetical protein